MILLGQFLLNVSSSTLPRVQTYFTGRSERLLLAMTKLAKSLSEQDVDYCIMGGNALQAHGYHRATTDVDVLMTQQGLERFVQTHLGRGYARRFQGAKTKFRSTADDIPIDILISGTFPGNSQTDIAFPEPKDISFEDMTLAGTVRFVDLANLILLKLVSYKDLPDTRAKDFDDVRKLIEINALDESFIESLNPLVHDLYLEAMAINKKEKEMEDQIL